tara:strand:+ start:349 stop:465 length:117 start_codon:yes stop_codon:yes gene_type:complete
MKGGLNDIAGTQWILDIQNGASMPLTSLKVMLRDGKAG